MALLHMIPAAENIKQ